MTRLIITSVLLAFLVWVSVHDIKTRKIENFTHILIIAAAFFINELSLAERILGFTACFFPFLIINIISKNGIGMGDVKFVGSMGFVLGVYGGLTAAIIGLLTLLMLCFLKNRIIKINKMRKAVPLAPFLCSGFALVLILQKGMM